MFTRQYLLASIILCFILSLSVFGDDDPVVWRPVTPEELQMKTPKVEADADAEAIFWEVTLDDTKRTQLSYSNYVRVKIFTERGRERFSRMDIPFTKGRRIENVAARIIRPDGSIVDLKPSDIFEREIIKAGRNKILAKSFAIPNIEPGVIVEYQYSETVTGDSADGERLIYQRDIPLQTVSYYIHLRKKVKLTARFYNMPEMQFVEDKDRKDFAVGTLHNVPGLKEEPFMPPEDEVRKWAYLSYPHGDVYFFVGVLNLSHIWLNPLQSVFQPSKDIKAKALELTKGATTDEEKVRRLYNFVQHNIKNVLFDRSLTAEKLGKIDIRSTDDILQHRVGMPFHLGLLFASLAKASGFETAVFWAPDRRENSLKTEKRTRPSFDFVPPSSVAVKVGNEWMFSDPGTPYLPFGMLPWYNEDTDVFLNEDEVNQKNKNKDKDKDENKDKEKNKDKDKDENKNKDFKLITIPISAPEKSPARRTGKFTLSADGTLEGTVKLEFEGQQAIKRRDEDYLNSQGKREQSIKDEILARMSTAEISDVVVENFDDTSKPLTYSLKVRVPNYGVTAGKRIIVQPGFFEQGSVSPFSSMTRINKVYFPYPWSEEDTVEIRLPAGYAVEYMDTPAQISDPQNIGRLKIDMRIDRATNVLSYNRQFHFGGGGHIVFPVSTYRALKGLFDSFNKANTKALSLRATN